MSSYDETTHVLLVSPIQAGRAEKSACALVMEPTIHFSIAAECWVEDLSLQGNPLQYGPFEALSVVPPGTRCTLADL